MDNADWRERRMGALFSQYLNRTVPLCIEKAVSDIFRAEDALARRVLAASASADRTRLCDTISWSYQGKPRKAYWHYSENREGRIATELTIHGYRIAPENIGELDSPEIEDLYQALHARLGTLQAMSE